MTGVQNPAAVEIFLYTAASRPAQPPIQWVPGREADHALFPVRASTPSRTDTWRFVKRRDKYSSADVVEPVEQMITKSH
jgi:hypothetical protein